MIKALELVYARYDGGAENLAGEYAVTLNKENFNTAIALRMRGFRKKITTPKEK